MGFFKVTNGVSVISEVEKKMKVEDGKKFGESEDMLLFGGFQELNVSQ